MPTDGYFGIENFGWGPDYWLDVYANMYEPWLGIWGYSGNYWEIRSAGSINNASFSTVTAEVLSITAITAN